MNNRNVHLKNLKTHLKNEQKNIKNKILRNTTLFPIQLITTLNDVKIKDLKFNTKINIFFYSNKLMKWN